MNLRVRRRAHVGIVRQACRCDGGSMLGAPQRSRAAQHEDLKWVSLHAAKIVPAGNIRSEQAEWCARALRKRALVAARAPSWRVCGRWLRRCATFGRARTAVGLLPDTRRLAKRLLYGFTIQMYTVPRRIRLGAKAVKP